MQSCRLSGALFIFPPKGIQLGNVSTKLAMKFVSKIYVHYKGIAGTLFARDEMKFVSLPPFRLQLCACSTKDEQNDWENTFF